LEAQLTDEFQIIKNSQQLTGSQLIPEIVLLNLIQKTQGPFNSVFNAKKPIKTTHTNSSVEQSNSWTPTFAFSPKWNRFPGRWTILWSCPEDNQIEIGCNFHAVSGHRPPSVEVSHFLQKMRNCDINRAGSSAAKSDMRHRFGVADSGPEFWSRNGILFAFGVS
jgi:hypothetical protein